MSSRLFALALLSVAVGCAPAPPPPPAPDTTPVAPTTAFVAAACTRELHVAEPWSPPTAPPVTPPGDVAPHEAENNGWKQRLSLTAEQIATAKVRAEALQPVLGALCDAGDFGLDAARKVFADLGVRPGEVEVGSTTAAPGVLYGLRVGGACVVGDYRPTSFRQWVEGPDGENSCLAPKTH